MITYVESIYTRNENTDQRSLTCPAHIGVCAGNACGGNIGHCGINGCFNNFGSCGENLCGVN